MENKSKYALGIFLNNIWAAIESIFVQLIQIICARFAAL